MTGAVETTEMLRIKQDFQELVQKESFVSVDNYKARVLSFLGLEPHTEDVD